MVKRSTRSRRNASSTESQESKNRNQRSSSLRRRRWPWVLLVLLVLIYFLPTIVVQTSLKQSAIDWALADFNGNVTAQNVSIGWFSPAKVSGLTATTDSGETLLEIDQVTTSKSLLGLMSLGNELGTIEIQTPHLFLELREDGSNLEDALEAYLKPSDEPTSPLPHLQVKLTGGVVQVSTPADAQTWKIDDLNLNTEIAGEAAALVAELQAAVHAADQPSGQLSAQLQLDSGANQILANDGVMSVQAESFPVSFLVPFGQRLIGPCNAIGQMNGQANIKFENGFDAVSAKLARLELTQFAMVAPQILKNDQLTLGRVLADGEVKLNSGLIDAVDFQTVSEVGKVTTNGRIDLAQLTSMVPTGDVPNSQFSAHGELDLARIAQMLPQTLGLHGDLQVQSGTLAFDASTRSEPGVRKFIVDIGASNLTAQRGGELLNWHQPLRVTANVSQTPNEVALERVRCESDFLTLEGSANTEVGNFQVEGDLAKLKASLSQFVDWREFDLAGEVSGEFGWSLVENPNQPGQQTARTEGMPVRVGGNFEILNPIVQMEGFDRWSAPQVSMVGNASGVRSDDGIIRINQGGMRTKIDQEVLVARLVQPIEDLAKTKSWELRCDASGRLDGWLAHIRNLMWFGDFEATGQVDSTCIATIDAEKIYLDNLQYRVDNMTFNGYGAQFRETEVVGDSNLSYEFSTGLIHVPVLNLTSSSVSGQAQEIKMTIDEIISVTGDIVFRADMNRITNWYGLSPDIDSVNWFGTAEGSVRLTSDQQRIRGELSGVVYDLVAAQRQTVSNDSGATPFRNASHGQNWSELIRDSKVDVKSEIGVAQDFNSFHFSDLQLVSQLMQVSGSGSIEDLAETWVTTIDGEWDPDWKKINGLLDAYTYKTVSLTGSGRQPLKVSGPLFSPDDSQYAEAWLPPQLRTQTRFAWDEGQFLTLPIGAGSIDVDVNQSVAFLQTGEISFVGGVLQMAPIIDLRTEEPILQLEKGALLNKINLSSEVCRDLLKYVTPLVADATEAQGQLSVTTEGVYAPIYQPMQTQARMTLSLHQGTVGAGPLAKQLLTAVAQIKQLLKPGSAIDLNRQSVWMDLGDQEIPLTIQEGRVYHQGFRMRVDDVDIRTTGFVGLDQSLSMTAEVPIQDDWLGNSPWLAGLRGQSLRIPISGTISKPRLDTDAVRQLSRDLLQQSAGSALNNIVEEKAGELGNKFGQEINRAQDKLNGKIQSELKDVLGNELQKGLEDIFKRKK